MNLTETFTSKQKELRGASLRGFMQSGDSGQLMLIFEKDEELIGMNIVEKKNGDGVSVGTDIDMWYMVDDEQASSLY
jgi:hypothetical protein